MSGLATVWTANNTIANMFSASIRDYGCRFFSSSLRICRGVRWEDKEVQRLREHVDADVKVIAAEFPARSKSAIRHKMDRLGLYSPQRRNDMSGERMFKIPWTEEDIQELKKCVKMDADLNSIVMKFPQRHPASIVTKVADLGLKYRRTRDAIKHDKRNRWTAEDDATLLSHVDRHHINSKSIRANMDLGSLATQLGRTPMSVSNRMRRINAKSTSAPGAGKLWTTEDLHLMSQWRAEGVKVKVIGDRLGRSELSIESQLKRMRKPRDRASERK